MGDHRSLLEIARYVSVSVVMYLYVLAAMYCLVGLAGVNKVLSYVLVYTSAYILEYTSTLWLVFQEVHRWTKLVKYI